ncbi:MAG: hypothetical protein A3J24_02230 [Deltaproteobacteria bacterium RIFCSPLOWO2_02_FULL_53_8]|nr:MAG: hypothetical protein A3J24_02230 [Deltaproteobacteria bacterium RIFCSPLOWO2_02_FULL_53_8]
MSLCNGLSRLAVVLSLCVSLSACVAGRSRDESRDGAAEARGGFIVKVDKAAVKQWAVYIEGVPFFPQKERKCGPAALASVINYWGGSVTLDKAASQVFNERMAGTLPMDMLIYAKEAGYDAMFYNGGLDDLKRKLSDKIPLILFLNMGYDLYPLGHYIVVVGYDDNAKTVLAYSDKDAKAVFTYEALDSAWGKTNYSTFLIKPIQPER